MNKNILNHLINTYLDEVVLLDNIKVLILISSMDKENIDKVYADKNYSNINFTTLNYDTKKLNIKKEQYDFIFTLPPGDITQCTQYYKAIYKTNALITNECKYISAVYDGFTDNLKTKTAKDFTELISIASQVIRLQVQNNPLLIKQEGREYILFAMYNIDGVIKDKQKQYLNFENYFIHQLDGLLLYDEDSYNRLSSLINSFEYTEDKNGSIQKYILNEIIYWRKRYTYIPLRYLNEYTDYIQAVANNINGETDCTGDAQDIFYEENYKQEYIDDVPIIDVDDYNINTKSIKRSSSKTPGIELIFKATALINKNFGYSPRELKLFKDGKLF